ncbi:MAG: DMT family transporter, partial [Verrucomicrobiota bacterium]
MKINHREHVVGVATVAGSSVIFAVMAGLIRYASHLDAWVMALTRFGIGIALIGTAAMGRKIALNFVRSRMLFLRGLLGGVGVVLYYISIIHIGLAKGTVIIYSYPIFAAIGGALFLGERLDPRRFGLIGLAFVGLYLTAMGRWSLDVGFALYEWLALLGAFLAGIVVCLIKKLHDTESTQSIFTAQCVVGFWVVLMPAQFSAGAIGVGGAIIIVAAGLLAAAGQLMMTYGFKYVEASTGALLGMLTPVLNVVAGLLLFGEAVT